MTEYSEHSSAESYRIESSHFVEYSSEFVKSFIYSDIENIIERGLYNIKLSLSVYEDAAIIPSSSQNIEYRKLDRFFVEPSDIQQFITMVDITSIEIGNTSIAEEFFRSICLERGYLYGIQMMNDIYIQHTQNVMLMCAVLNILSHIDYEKIGSFAVTLCMGLITTGTPEIDEYVINAIDRWNHHDFVVCIKSIRTKSFLLQRMLKKVITRLSEL